MVNFVKVKRNTIKRAQPKAQKTPIPIDEHSEDTSLVNNLLVLELEL
jgi:hypothetical protein